jgi:hypothetical protein
LAPATKNAASALEPDLTCGALVFYQLSSSPKFGGPQRLKMRLGVQPDARQFKFRYYCEEFGLVPFP